jgi:hypothetical protein
MSADPDLALLATSLVFAGAAVAGSAVAIREQLPGITFPCRSRRGCWLAGGRRCRAVADACGAVIAAARSQRTEPSALTGGICAGSA